MLVTTCALVTASPSAGRAKFPFSAQDPIRISALVEAVLVESKMHSRMTLGGLVKSTLQVSMASTADCA